MIFLLLMSMMSQVGGDFFSFNLGLFKLLILSRWKNPGQNPPWIIASLHFDSQCFLLRFFLHRSDDIDKNHLHPWNLT